MPEAILVDPCNFVDYPTGGQLSFAKQLMKAYGDRLALVGVSTDCTPVGCWMAKQFDGHKFMYLSFCRCTHTHKRPLVPGRLKAVAGLMRYRRQIFGLGVRNLLTQSPEALISLSNLPWESICYCLAGAENPLRRSRYHWARSLSKLFDRSWIKSLRRADVILACADRPSIDRFLQERHWEELGQRIIPFPTRYDDAIFYPVPIEMARSRLGIPLDCIVLATIGRINITKGWDLALNGFKIFLAGYPNSLLFFVGDGEDRDALLRRAARIGVETAVHVTGFLEPRKVAEFINAADLVVFGSQFEGWSVAMLEALGCGKPIVTTEVSGVHDLILEGRNGLIVRERQPECLAKAMSDALRLTSATCESIRIAQRYRLADLGQELGRIWPPLVWRAE
ncbi:MAG: glycosyltransferase family 4 protein [Sedimentisphaerales bacterium]|nr:glycosyltransferase family 4 protein [Sedimentisphaerales bacterium]